MDNLLLYVIEANLSIALLFGVYYLVLRNSPYFGWNRFYLLAALILSISIPLIDFSQFNANILYVVQLEALNVGAQLNSTVQETAIPPTHIFLYIYLIISTLMILKMMWHLVRILQIRAKSKVEIHPTTATRVYINPFQNFSFFGWLFIRFDDSNNQAIIEHEKSHAKLFHSFDIVLVKLFQSFFWFNPVLFLMEKELRLQHEYVVDKKVLTEYQNILDYQQLLLNQVFNAEFNLFSNHFNQSFLLNRFTMMTKKENKKSPLFIAAALLLMISIPIIVGCSMEKQNNQQEETQQKSDEGVNAPKSSAEDATLPATPAETGAQTLADTSVVFMVVEEMPEFPGGQEKMFEYLRQNINYPEAAKKNGVTGKVFVNFVVEKDGTISTVQITRGIGGGCDEEAVRVIKSMPNWKPGKQRGEAMRVQFQMPINFVLK